MISKKYILKSAFVINRSVDLMAQHMIMNAGSNWPHAGKGSSSNSCTVENVVSHILQIYIRLKLEVLQPILFNGNIILIT